MVVTDHLCVFHWLPGSDCWLEQVMGLDHYGDLFFIGHRHDRNAGSISYQSHTRIAVSNGISAGKYESNKVNQSITTHIPIANQNNFRDSILLYAHLHTSFDFGMQPFG